MKEQYKNLNLENEKNKLAIKRLKQDNESLEAKLKDFLIE